MAAIPMIVELIKKRGKAMPHKRGGIILPVKGGGLATSKGKGKSHNVAGLSERLTGGVDTRPRTTDVDGTIAANVGSLVAYSASGLWRKAGL